MYRVRLARAHHPVNNDWRKYGVQLGSLVMSPVNINRFIIVVRMVRTGGENFCWGRHETFNNFIICCLREKRIGLYKNSRRHPIEWVSITHRDILVWTNWRVRFKISYTLSSNYHGYISLLTIHSWAQKSVRYSAISSTVELSIFYLDLCRQVTAVKWSSVKGMPERYKIRTFKCMRVCMRKSKSGILFEWRQWGDFQFQFIFLFTPSPPPSSQRHCRLY